MLVDDGGGLFVDETPSISLLSEYFSGSLDFYIWQEITILGRIFGQDTTCKDEMVPRRLSFAEPKTFTKLKLTIKEVYPTTKWDDTPITEIRLYLDGEELEVDISRFKGNLEKLSEP